jgi:hypothetical protein
MPHFEIREIPEVPLDEVPTEEFELIKNALASQASPYRTINGIQTDTGIPAEHIATVLDNSGLARRTVYHQEPGHQAVYTAADLKKPFRERLAEIRWMLAR